MTEKKMFKTTCQKCRKEFHLSFSLVKADAEGKGGVMITCPYCDQTAMIEIPRKYIENGAPIYRGE
jgi:RNase P subunit RPR2